MNIKSIFQVAQHLFFGVVTSLSAAMPTVSATMLQQPPSTPPPASAQASSRRKTGSRITPQRWSGLVQFSSQVTAICISLTTDGQPRLLIRRNG